MAQRKMKSLTDIFLIFILLTNIIHITVSAPSKIHSGYLRADQVTGRQTGGGAAAAGAAAPAPAGAVGGIGEEAAALGQDSIASYLSIMDQVVNAVGVYDLTTPSTSSASLPDSKTEAQLSSVLSDSIATSNSPQSFFIALSSSDQHDKPLTIDGETVSFASYLLPQLSGDDNNKPEQVAILLPSADGSVIEKDASTPALPITTSGSPDSSSNPSLPTTSADLPVVPVLKQSVEASSTPTTTTSSTTTTTATTTTTTTTQPPPVNNGLGLGSILTRTGSAGLGVGIAGLAYAAAAMLPLWLPVLGRKKRSTEESLPENMEQWMFRISRAIEEPKDHLPDLAMDLVKYAVNHWSHHINKRQVEENVDTVNEGFAGVDFQEEKQFLSPNPSHP